jgi:hypothetical protein
LFLINPARWDRVREEINFQDLVQELTGHHSHDKIRCPFHGIDRTPSFGFYPKNNNGFCWGCPPGEQFWDNVSFVAKHFSIDKVKALLWLESTNNLSAIPDLEDEEAEEAEEAEITCEDLKEPFVIQAGEEVQACAKKEGADSALQLATEYIRIYFNATQARINPVNPDYNDPMPMARALEPAKLEAARRKKARE